MRKLILLMLVLVSGSAVQAASDVADKFSEGSDLLMPYIVLSDGMSVDPTNPSARATILRGVQLLSEAAQDNPDNWAAFWFIGKGHQALRDHASAQMAFKQAYALNSSNPSVAREFMIELICTGRFATGVKVAESIVALHPDHADLLANLGLAYLANGQLTQARTAIDKAVALDQDDKITQALLKEVKAVQGGRKPSPYCPN